MKKIVLVTEAMLSGIRQHICDIATSLPKNKYEVYLVYSEKRADDGWYIAKQQLQEEMSVNLIECQEMERELGIHDLAAYRHLIKIFGKIKPDIVHCHSSKAGIVGRLAARKCGVSKILYTPNSYAFQNPNLSSMKKKVYMAAECFLSHYATTLTINVSEGEQQEAMLHKLDKLDKFAIIYNGIPDKILPEKQELRRKLGLREDVYYIGVTARCGAQKDPMTFLEIARQVIHQDNDIEFVYIGDGELLPQMKACVKKWKLEEKIHLLGFHSDASVVVGALDAYLSTALYEGMPYSILEAMRAGIPIFATDVVGNNELVFNNQNGFLYPVKDVIKARDLLLQQKRKNMITHEMVKEAFCKKFSLEVMLNKLITIYDI